MKWWRSHRTTKTELRPRLCFERIVDSTYHWQSLNTKEGYVTVIYKYWLLPCDSKSSSRKHPSTSTPESLRILRWSSKLFLCGEDCFDNAYNSHAATRGWWKWSSRKDQWLAYVEDTIFYIDNSHIRLLCSGNGTTGSFPFYCYIIGALPDVELSSPLVNTCTLILPSLIPMPTIWKKPTHKPVQEST